MKLENALKQFGLSEKQAKIYLATLELGSAPVNLIAKKSEIPRPTCYDLLESLCKQGIASNFIKKKTRYYSVDDPRQIVHLAQQKAKILEETLPQLEAIYGLAKERPKVRFYQGKEGMKQILEEVLKDKQECLCFSSADDLFETLGDDFLKFVQQRIKLKIPTRVILKDSPVARERQRLGLKELRKVKIIPNEFNYHGMIFIFGNKIAFFSFVKDYMAVIIESKELSAIQQAMFECIWKREN